MSNQDGLTRRQVIAAGVGAAGVAAIATAASGAGGSSTAANASGERTQRTSGRMPVAFIPHGGGPWPWIDVGRLGITQDETTSLTAYLDAVRALPTTKPKALLVISAHWEERVPTVMTSARPPMFYDYYGFPQHTYEITWPAPGEPAIAARVRELLEGAGIPSGTDDARGFDHGTFVPLKLVYPDADIPTLQLSLKHGLDPAEHAAIGRALAPLRDEGVFIVGSGMSYHNMRGFRTSGDPTPRGHAATFDAWLRDAATSAPADRAAKLAAWAEAPAGRESHPREEHLLPLMVIAGAAGDDRGVVGWNGTFGGLRLSAIHYGA